MRERERERERERVFNSRKDVLNLVYYLLNAYINMNVVYFEINHKNGLIWT